MRSLLQPILTSEGMRAADQYTIEQLGLPGFTLMETAGRESARHIEDYIGPLYDDSITIYCGKGNNGGDGLVVARWLASRRYNVQVILLDEDVSEDAARNLRILREISEHVQDVEVDIVSFKNLRQLASLGTGSLHVDALLGTGLTSNLRSPMSELVTWINQHPAPTLAIDVPTGIHSDTGAVMGEAIRADLTLTMGALKCGLTTGAGKQHAGTSVVVDIGIPRYVLNEQAQQSGCGWLTTDAFITASLPERASDAYKYSVGFALVIAGAPGMTGAPAMTSEAAARIGAGYVSCATPLPAESTLASKLTEVTIQGLPVRAEDGIDPDGALKKLEASINKTQAMAVGPGMGRARHTQMFVRKLLEQTAVPTVVDADGLFALSDDWLRDHGRGDMLLTPHEGEFKRLAPDADLSKRFSTVQHYADRWNVALLLKGDPTLIAAPENGRTFAVSAGNPALATAGTGDVLTGCCVGLMAQGLSPGVAAACAAHIGGRCAETYAATRDVRSMIATDIISELPAVLHTFH